MFSFEIYRESDYTIPVSMGVNRGAGDIVPASKR
jgi:hypothetical protein